MSTPLESLRKTAKMWTDLGKDHAFVRDMLLRLTTEQADVELVLNESFPTNDRAATKAETRQAEELAQKQADATTNASQDAGMFPNIPDVFKGYDNWLTYKSAEEKAPIISGTSAYAKSNDPSTWVSYSTLCENIRAGRGYKGVGFIPDGERTGYLTAIDIDNCVDTLMGTTAEWAQRIVNFLHDTYTERTVSGSGLRAWVIIRHDLHTSFGLNDKAKANPELNKGAQIEVVNDKQYMTISCDVLPSSVKTVRELSAAEADAFFQLLKELQNQYSSSAGVPGTAGSPNTNSFDEVFSAKKVYSREADGLLHRGRHCATVQELGHMHERKEHQDYDSRLEAITEWREKNVFNPHENPNQDEILDKMVEWSLKLPPSTKVTLNQKPDPVEQARAAVLQAEHEQQRRNERLQELLEYTDVQNAELFVQNNKDFVRANFGGSKGRTTWYWWDGARWKEDSAGKVVELAKQTAVEQAETVLEQLTEAFRSGDEAQQKALAKRCKMARECCSDHRIHSMLNLAAAGTEISVVMTQLDGQPNLVNFKNGTLDLDTMELRPHRKEDLLTQLIPINYDPNAKCPKWKAFVERIFRDKPYMPDYLQRVVGYFLAGRNPEQVFFIFYGLPGGGKTTLRNVLKALIGEYAKTCPQGMFLMGYRRQSPDAPSPSHADLYGARLVLSEELDEDEKLDCRMVKMVSGGGEVKARPLYKPPFEYAPDYKLLFLTNHTPKISDFSGAIDDRLRVVKMEQRLRDTSEEVHDYHKVLIKEELEGILAWAIQGLKDTKAQGLQDPKEVRLMTSSFMQSENIVQEWLDERAEQGEGAFSTASEAHRDFVWWAKQRGEDTKPMTPRWFGLRMSHLGWVSDSGKSGTARGYHGLKLRPQPGAITLSNPVSFKRPAEYDVEPERVN